MNQNDELQQAADEARKQREALAKGHEPQTASPDDGDAPPNTPDDSAQNADENDAPPKQAPLPDFEKQFAEPAGEGGETVEELKRQLAESQRELAAAKVRAGSAAGRLKNRDETSNAEMQQLRDRNVELEARLAELTAAGDDDDNLEPEILKNIDKRVERALTPLQERFQKSEEDSKKLLALRDQERLETLHARMAEIVPDYRDVANTPEWMEFLKETEPMTATTFGRLARAAHDARDPNRLAVIFNAFKQAQGLPVAQNPKVRSQMRPPTNHSVTAPQEKAVPKVYTYEQFRAHYDRVETEPDYLKDPKNAALHEELKKARAEGRIQR